MCGIAGVVDPNRPAGVLQAQAERLCHAMSHRGPDDRDVRAADGWALGHARLSIIDLSPAGRQPMTNETGTLHLVVNGEIYNYRRLREELEACGHRFRSHSDSEVVLHLYEEHGDGCLAKLDGMFALALWDEPRRRLLLARDRFGIKPLYLAERNGGVAFASELTALLCSGAAELTIDPSALYAYMALSYVPGPHTIVAGVCKVLPAERVVWQDGRLARSVYWTPSVQPWAGSRADAREAVADALDRSVRAHLVADVPVAAFLSGGVDSSAVTAVAQRHRPMQTFCMSFAGTNVDEAPIARAVARHVGTDHRDVSLDLKPWELLSQATEFMDEPFADSSALPTFAVCRAARERVKVVLSGDGGDEVFGGYTGRYRVAALQAAVPVPSTVARWLRRLPPWRSGRRQSFPRMLDLAALPDRERFVAEREITSAADRAALFGTARAAREEPKLREIPGPAIAQAQAWHPVHRALWVDLAAPLADDMLTKVDRMSMAHGLEVRVPLLDHRLVELALSLPPHWLVSPWPVEGKRVLREVAAPLLPPGILDRPKQGFVVPLNRWLHDDLLGRFDALCLGSDAELGNWCDPAGVAARRGVPLGAEPRHDLYALLVLEMWLRRQKRGTA